MLWALCIPPPQVTFDADPAGVWYLGISLLRNEGAAREGLYTTILQQFSCEMSGWPGHHISFLGDAKQMLSCAFHLQLPWQADTLGTACMFPRREVCAHEPSQGAVSLEPQQLAALQAQGIGRLMELKAAAIKGVLHNWLYQSREWLTPRAQRWTARRSTFGRAGCGFLILPILDIMHETLFHHGASPTTQLPLAWLMWARRAHLRVGDLRALVSARLEDVPKS